MTIAFKGSKLNGARPLPQDAPALSNSLTNGAARAHVLEN